MTSGGKMACELIGIDRSGAILVNEVEELLRVAANCEECGAHPKRYAAGTWGPVASIAMITRDDRSWYEEA